MLFHERLTLDFFFEDKNGKNRASETFMSAVLTQLISVLYRPTDIIIKSHKEVRSLYFIAEGTCKLYGSYEDKNENLVKRIPIVRLREGSWYGDY